jgi:hypothetical protein
MLSESMILARANELYEEAKGYKWDGYTAPELRPQIQSDQVKCLLAAIVEALNERVQF